MPKMKLLGTIDDLGAGWVELHATPLGVDISSGPPRGPRVSV